jgi:four helix bundle protein
MLKGEWRGGMANVAETGAARAGDTDRKRRTKRFSIDVIGFCRKLPETPEMRVIRYQLLRCSTSVGANYRSACRAQSTAHFVSKLSIVEEQADESMFWMEVRQELGWKDDQELRRLLDEADQLVGIFVASKKTARRSM